MKISSDKPSHSLTIYLAKVDVSDTRELIRTKQPVKEFIIGPEESPIGILFAQSGFPKPPRWAKYFEKHMDTGQLGQVSSAAAALIVGSRERLFAITFGHGRYLLAQEHFEERFGLRVALNCLGENNVRSIDKRTFDAIARHSREQASREAAAYEFGLDVEQDLLRAVTGTPTDPSLGKRMYGMEALNVTVSVEITEVQRLLSRYYERYLDTSYKKTFPWVDQIAEVTDRLLRDELDRILIARIKSGDTKRIWMAVPEVIEWEHVSGFRYGSGRHCPEYHDIHLDQFLKSLSDPDEITKDVLVHRSVLCIDNEGLPFEKWPVYRCLYGEIDHDGNSYVLSGGKWYRVANDFVAEVNEAYLRIPTYSGSLPEYDDESEGAYNDRVVGIDPENFALMDRKLIAFGGAYSRIEFCDILTRERDIIHIKRYANSSVLSHLFSQGLVSGELFQTDPRFRTAVNGMLPEGFRMADTTPRPRQGEYKVVFAVISDVPGELTLPFFSRLNIKHAVRRLTGYGFEVMKAKIPVREARAKLTKYKSA